MKLLISRMLFLSAFLTALTSNARAAITVAKSSSGPIKLGYEGTFKVTGMIPIISRSYKWETKQSDTWEELVSEGEDEDDDVYVTLTCNSPWTNTYYTSDETGNIGFGVPGTFQIKCTVTYLQMPMDPPPPSAESFALTFTVPAPKGASLLTTNVDTDIAYNSGAPIYFRILTNGNYFVGPHHGLKAQERITSVVFDGVPQPDNTWLPDPPPSTVFKLASALDDGVTSIYDYKGQSGAPFPIGTFLTYTQENRLLWSDRCNQQRTQKIGAFNLKHVGVSSTKWQVQSN